MLNIKFHIFEFPTPLCSRNIQNVKLRLDFVDILSFYRHSDFTWNSNSPKRSFLTISETLIFEFLVNLGLQICSNLLISKLWTFKIAKNDIFGRFEFNKIWFRVKSDYQIATKSSLNFTFWKFLEHSASGAYKFTYPKRNYQQSPKYLKKSWDQK